MEATSNSPEWNRHRHRTGTGTGHSLQWPLQCSRCGKQLAKLSCCKIECSWQIQNDPSWHLCHHCLLLLTLCLCGNDVMRCEGPACAVSFCSLICCQICQASWHIRRCGANQHKVHCCPLACSLFVSAPTVQLESKSSKNVFQQRVDISSVSFWEFKKKRKKRKQRRNIWPNVFFVHSFGSMQCCGQLLLFCNQMTGSDDRVICHLLWTTCWICCGQSTWLFGALFFDSIDLTTWLQMATHVNC